MTNHRRSYYRYAYRYATRATGCAERRTRV